MKRALIFFNGIQTGVLSHEGSSYIFDYLENYQGHPISLTMPTIHRRYEFSEFPPFFDGLLPEGIQLEGLLRQEKLDRDDYFGQLLAVGKDLVGAITVRALDS